MTYQVQFCSSVGGSPLIRRLAMELNGLGCGAAEYSLVNGEDYRGAPSRLARWRMIGLMYAVYPAFFLARFAGRRRPVTQVVTTNPFFMPYLAALGGGRRNPRVVNLLWDLYPDALELAGILRSDSWGSRLLGRITAGALRRCAATVFLGTHLREHVERRYGPARRAVVIPVGADGTPFRDCPPVPTNEQAPVTLLYCGNLGRLHDYRTLYDALQQLRAPTGIQGSGGARDRRLRVAIHGHGTGFRSFQALATADSVTAGWELGFGPNLDGEAWAAQMQSVEVALVTLSQGAEKVMMPSKAYSALVAGQALLAITPEDSDLADLVRKHDCGWVVAPGDAPRLAEVLREIQTEPANLLHKRRNAFRTGHENYDLAVVARQWLALLKELQRETPRNSVSCSRGAGR